MLSRLFADSLLKGKTQEANLWSEPKSAGRLGLSCIAALALCRLQSYLGSRLHKKGKKSKALAVSRGWIVLEAAPGINRALVRVCGLHRGTACAGDGDRLTGLWRSSALSSKASLHERRKANRSDLLYSPAGNPHRLGPKPARFAVPEKHTTAA